jgi:hypothetical protein
VTAGVGGWYLLNTRANPASVISFVTAAPAPTGLPAGHAGPPSTSADPVSVDLTAKRAGYVTAISVSKTSKRTAVFKVGPKTTMTPKALSKYQTASGLPNATVEARLADTILLATIDWSPAGPPAFGPIDFQALQLDGKTPTPDTVVLTTAEQHPTAAQRTGCTEFQGVQ